MRKGHEPKNIGNIAMKILRHIRLVREISLEGMGEATSLTYNSYRVMETGKGTLTVDRLFLICAALEISPYKLMKEVEMLSTVSGISKKALDEICLGLVVYSNKKITT